MESPAVPAASTSASVASPWWVVCLCAQWCGTCRDYRAVFDQLARAHPAVRFVWIDIEDDAEVAGDLDVETFPTLLLADGQVARFLGPLLPQAAVLSRLLESLQSRSSHPRVDALGQGGFDRWGAAND